MDNSYKYFENRDCKYFPCHNLENELNCLFCFCPLYPLEHCPGDYKYIESDGKKTKSCISCTFPHKSENYDKIMQILKHHK